MATVKSDREKRRRLRRRLVERGLSAPEVEQAIARKARRQEEARRRAAAAPAPERDEQWLARQERLSEEVWQQPDDKGFKPRTPDPLQTGSARVSAATARAARRGKALTLYEYQQLEGGR